ncbi:hypothetical protein ACFL6I_26310 [candidate division KSB1 bacterium]
MAITTAIQLKSKPFLVFLQVSLVILFLQFHANPVQAQYDNIDELNVLYRHEKSGFAMLYSDGWGIGYRQGKHITGFKKRMYEVELQVNRKHPKEVKSLNILFNNSKRYVYGKLNYLSVLRGGIGIQKVLNDKPYWGGVQVRYYYSGGVSLGFTRPYYLYIINYTDSQYEFYLTDEAYDPDKHYISDIYGRGPFGKGFGKIKIHPGIYGKFAFNFEFGEYQQEIRSLEVGIIVDAYLEPIPIMAYDTNKQYNISLFVSIHFGKRFNK